jgi:nitroreductase
MTGRSQEMEFLELVRARQSIRSYIQKPIEREMLLKCIEAARLAPSACNAQPWKFIVIDDRDLIIEIAQKICHSVYAINKFIKYAGALVVVVSDKERFLRKVGAYIRGTNYYLIDIGIACEHLLLQATELGLGSCWIGWFDEKRLKKILSVPRDKKIDVVISLGNYRENKLKIKSRRCLEEICLFNIYK